MKTMIKYCTVQGLFWMLFCSCYGYITFYLLGQGFAAGEIGFITAAFGVLGALLQPVFGRLVDKGKCNWKILAIILFVLMTINGTLLCFIKIKILQGILFGLTMVSLNSSMPLINRAGFICETEDQKINFGVARGIGSLSYAVLSLILGRLTLIFGGITVPVSIVIVAALMIIALLFLPYGKVAEVESDGMASSIDLIGMVKKYPEFFIIWISCILQMAFHNLSGTYLIQICERAGGTSQTMGIALAIAAVLELPIMFCFTIINKHISAKRLLLISGITFVIKAVGYVASVNIPILFITQFTQILSFAVYASASVYYAEEAVSPEDKTTAQSFMSNSQTVGSVLGSVVGGILIQNTNLNITLLAGVGIAVVGAILAIRK